MQILRWFTIWFKICLVFIVLAGAIACSPIATNSPTSELTTPVATPSITSPDSTAPSEEVIQRLKTELEQNLGIATDEIQVKQSAAVEWGDACLGLPQADELCAQVVIPGYQVVFTTPQGDYQVHSDRTGETVRIAQSS